MKKIKLGFFILLFLFLSLFGYMNFTHSTFNDMATKVLSWVKTLKGDAVNLEDLENKSTQTIEHEVWTELLHKHVSTSGTVDYKGFISDENLLDSYLATLTDNPPGTNWSDDEKMAYWINAYNAFTVKLILNHYPIKSIKDITKGLPIINSPWSIKFFKIGPTDFDLHTIEHEILRKQFIEPRIHFAINCASFSCPNLRNEAFEADELDQQLEDQTRAFINNPHKNTINANETKISSIFSWFESDFTKKESLKSFIGRYHDELNEKNKIQYLDYDWSLNE